MKGMRWMKWTSAIRLRARDAGLGICVRRTWGWSGEFLIILDYFFVRLDVRGVQLLIHRGGSSGRCDGAPYCQCQ